MKKRLTSKERLEKISKINENFRLKKKKKINNLKRRKKRKEKIKEIIKEKKKEEKKLLREKKYVPFEEFKNWMKKISPLYGINSYKKWFKIVSEYEIPKNIPKYPNIEYKNKIKSSDEFFFKPVRIYLTYDAAKLYISKYNLNTFSEWREWYVKNKPSFIPSEPCRFYKDYGWISWNDFLSNGKLNYWLPYDQAIKYVHKLKIKNQKEWRKLCLDGKIPKEIPHRPDVVYKEWNNLSEWLGITLSDILKVKDNNTSILFILHENGHPSNVYTIGIEKDGLFGLENWDEIENFKIIKLFEFTKDKKERFNQILNDNCSPWLDFEDSNIFIVQNIYSLISELEFIFKNIKIEKQNYE